MDKKQVLKTAAYDVFSKKGYKATAISEIAKQAGVAVGSFYNYYDSKEAIFLDVYVDENNRVRQAMINELDWEMNDMVGLVSQIFRRSRSYVSSNKILTEWYNPLISDELHKYYSSEEGKVANPFHQFLVETFTNRMVEEGYSQKKFKKSYKFIICSTTWICTLQKMIFRESVKLLKYLQLTSLKEFLNNKYNLIIGELEKEE